MTKAVREEKGKVPKSNRNTAKEKNREVLQRRVQLPLGELRKDVRKKVGNFWKWRAPFPYRDLVSKAGKTIKLS